jgi:hypothetical protein
MLRRSIAPARDPSKNHASNAHKIMRLATWPFGGAGSQPAAASQAAQRARVFFTPRFSPPAMAITSSILPQTHENKKVPPAVAPDQPPPPCYPRFRKGSAVRHAASGRPQPKRKMLKYTEIVGFAVKNGPQPTATQVGYAKLVSNAQFYLRAEPVHENAGWGAGNAATRSHTPVPGRSPDSSNLRHP